MAKKKVPAYIEVRPRTEVVSTKPFEWIDAFYYRIVARNGHVLAFSNQVQNKRNAKRAAMNFNKNIAHGEMEIRVYDWDGDRNEVLIDTIKP